MTDPKETQRRLLQWGLSCRRESERLGLPQISQIAIMIEHVQREDRLRKGVRKTRKTEERVRTAQGKQTKAARRPGPIVSGNVLEVDKIIAGMDDEWLRNVLIHAYLLGRSDRTCCQDLRISKGTYRQWREAAEEYVGERLATPRISTRIPVTPS